jgi:hypothetical protein
VGRGARSAVYNAPGEPAGNFRRNRVGWVCRMTPGLRIGVPMLRVRGLRSWPFSRVMEPASSRTADHLLMASDRRPSRRPPRIERPESSLPGYITPHIRAVPRPRMSRRPLAASQGFLKSSRNELQDPLDDSDCDRRSDHRRGRVGCHWQHMVGTCRDLGVRSSLQRRLQPSWPHPALVPVDGVGPTACRQRVGEERRAIQSGDSRRRGS